MNMFPYREPEVPLTEDQRLMRKRVYCQVTDEPSTFDMSYWEHDPPTCGECTRDADTYSASLVTCGTTRCIAGWAQYFDRGYVTVDDSPRVTSDAITALGLTREEYTRTGGSLFLAENDIALRELRTLAGED